MKNQYILSELDAACAYTQAFVPQEAKAKKKPLVRIFGSVKKNDLLYFTNKSQFAALSREKLISLKNQLQEIKNQSTFKTEIDACDKQLQVINEVMFHA
jgi:hypothetical protein